VRCTVQSDQRQIAVHVGRRRLSSKIAIAVNAPEAEAFIRRHHRQLKVATSKEGTDSCSGISVLRSVPCSRQDPKRLRANDAQTFDCPFDGVLDVHAQRARLALSEAKGETGWGEAARAV
jgi:hypothetical protein